MPTETHKARFVRRAGIEVPFTTKPVSDLPELTGTVRPCSAGERGRWFDQEYPALAKAHGHDGAMSHLYAKYIATWDYFADDTAADPLPITPENVASLPPPVFEQLGNIVSGVGLGNSSAGG